MWLVGAPCCTIAPPRSSSGKSSAIANRRRDLAHFSATRWELGTSVRRGPCTRVFNARATARAC